jgi:hypothetical protein
VETLTERRVRRPRECRPAQRHPRRVADPQGYVLEGAENSAAVLALGGGRQQGVQQQLTVLRALHHVSAEHHHHTVAFFDRHIGEVR